MCELNRLKRIGLKALTVFILGLLFLALLPGKTLAEPASQPGTESSGKPGTASSEKPGTESSENPEEKPGIVTGGKIVHIYLYEGSQGTSKASVEEIRAGKPAAGVVFRYWKFTKVPDGFDLNQKDPKEMNDQLNEVLDQIRDGDMPKENLDRDPKKASKTQASDARGHIIVQGLTPGLYYFEEDQSKKPPVKKGEEPPKKETHFAPFLVVITETSDDQAIYPKAYETELPGGLILKKVDDQGKGLASAVFHLYDSQGQAVSVYKISNGIYDTAPKKKADELTEELVTDAKGQIKVDTLPPGDYYFKEVEPPPGFSLLKDKTETITVGPGEAAEKNIITVKNYRTYRFFKYDAKTDKPVKNATFHLVVRGTLGRWKDYDNSKGTVEVQSGADGAWTPAGNPVVVKSGADGWFAIRGLPKDTYGLKPGVKEVTAPDGYKKNDRVYPFAVGLDQGTKVPNEPEESSSVSSEDSSSSSSSSKNPSSSDRYDSENPPPWDSKNPPPKIQKRKIRILPRWVPQLPTGDPGFWTLVGLGAGALIFLIVSRRRKKREEEE